MIEGVTATLTHLDRAHASVGMHPATLCASNWLRRQFLRKDIGLGFYWINWPQ